MAKKFKQWYAKNGDSLNERRRKKYKTDAAYRKAAIDRARTYRANKPALPVPGTGMVSAAAAAEAIGRSPQVLVAWEKAKLIPKQKINGVRRYYERQLELLGAVAEACSMYHIDRDQYRSAIKAVKARVSAEWNKQ